jgi:hypothetical protein
MAASHLRSSLVTFDFTGTLTAIYRCSRRDLTAPLNKSHPAANIPVIIRGGEKGSGVINDSAEKPLG